VARSLLVNLFWLAFAGVVVATAISVVTLWPDDVEQETPLGLARPETLRAEVVALAAAPCPAPGQRDCRRATIELREGPDEGERARPLTTCALGTCQGPAPGPVPRRR
jgi:hypothetical protein